MALYILTLIAVGFIGMFLTARIVIYDDWTELVADIMAGSLVVLITICRTEGGPRIPVASDMKTKKVRGLLQCFLIWIIIMFIINFFWGDQLHPLFMTTPEVKA